MNTKQPKDKLYALPVLKSGKRLSWHKDAKGGRWCKKFQGKVRYFGSANSKYDYPAYKLALAAAEQFVEEHNKEVMQRKSNAVEQAIEDKAAAMMIELLKAEDDVEKAHLVANLPIMLDPQTGKPITTGVTKETASADIEVAEANARRLWELHRRKEREAEGIQVQQHGPVTNVHKLLELFLEATKQRQLLTEQHPETLPKKKRLTLRSYQAINYGISAFRDYIDSRKLKKMPTGDKLEKLLYDYREHHMQLLIEGRCKKGTVTAKVKHLQPLFTWLHTHHHIDVVPRNLKDVTQQLPSDGGGKPVDVKAIQELWKHADSRSRCFILLGLNCAMYTSEIAELKAEHLHDGYIAKKRRKTEAPYKIKLWKMTQDAIEAERDDTKRDTNGLLFVTEKGNPVYADTEKGRTDSVAQRLRRIVKAAKQKMSWKQLRNTTCEHIEALADKNGVGNDLASAVLQHTDKRMARTYLDQDPRNLSTVQLDKCIGELEGIYGLDLAAEVKKKSRHKRKK